MTFGGYGTTFTMCALEIALLLLLLLCVTMTGKISQSERQKNRSKLMANDHKAIRNAY